MACISVIPPLPHLLHYHTHPFHIMLRPTKLTKWSNRSNGGMDSVLGNLLETRNGISSTDTDGVRPSLMSDLNGSHDTRVGISFTRLPWTVAHLANEERSRLSASWVLSADTHNCRSCLQVDNLKPDRHWQTNCEWCSWKVRFNTSFGIIRWWGNNLFISNQWGTPLQTWQTDIDGQHLANTQRRREIWRIYITGA